MHSGDTFNESGNDPRKRLLALMTASYYNDPYLMTMAESDFFNNYGDFDCIFEILFKEPNAEKRPINELPLTKYFPSPMGEMIARTGWNMGIDSNDAIVQMRIGEYFFGNHQCKDFGIFQIYYRGALAISSGVYDVYGNEHWKNYLHQTISKNGLLIFDPDEKMGKGSVNDGGQRWVEGSDHPKDLEILLTKDYKMGQVIAYEFGPDKLIPEYSYISGDITNAYSPNKVDKVTRSMVTFNTQNEKYPSIFVVMDRVRSKKPTFKKTWLLHSIQEPEIENKTITVIRDGKAHNGKYSGKLIVKSLMPEKSEIRKIGGKDKEFWIESVQKNYPAHKEGITEGGAWRVEVSPLQDNEYDIFLHVMSVMDIKTKDIPEVVKIEQDNLIGAKVLNYAVLFSKDGNPVDSAKININGGFKILICDLKSGVWSISHNDLNIGEFKVSDDGKCIYFEGKEGVYKLVKKS
ncbi:MAG: heparinase II/III domain-containing protein, partial [Candidatus Poribacteria bacterium]